MCYTDIDSLGRCLHNRSFAEFDNTPTAWANNGFHEVAEILRHYKFYIAFENSSTLDYVTERVFMALAYGSVPIYHGAPNVDELMPSKKCMINASDFSSAKELAEYINFLDDNDFAYDEYFTLALHKFPEF